MKISKNIPAFNPMTAAAQMALINNENLNGHMKITKFMLRNRARLWQQGTAQDLKRGGYFACCRDVSPEQNAYADLFDHLILDRTRTQGEGWTRGLESNVAFKVKNGPFVLVMDNHNFATPFILDMLDRGVIGFDNRMIHIDRHADLYPGCRMALVEYTSLKTERERFGYVLRRTSVGDWTEPLLRASVISRGAFMWMMVHEGRETWTLNEEAESESIIIDEHKFLDRFEELNGADMVDVDIDFLEHMDFMLTDKEKKDVLAGTVPLNISYKLGELIPFIFGSKVTTIAFSPCYIEQNRAMVYIKHLLSMLGSTHTYG